MNGNGNGYHQDQQRFQAFGILNGIEIVEVWVVDSNIDGNGLCGRSNKTARVSYFFFRIVS